MLRVRPQDSSQVAKDYYATADYYSEGQEIVGLWGGRGAERLGLKGVVDKASFDRLCDNINPTTLQPLTVRSRSDRIVGYDFTFSVPKSVSLLYALTGDSELLAAFREAVNDTMQDIEGEMKTRVRKGKRNEDRDTGNMLWAEFIHTTSRPVDGVPDPQLHAHCFAFNATWDQEEERWKAGKFRGLKTDSPFFQAGFRVRLAGKLQELGFGITRKRDDFEVTGIPASAIKKFSRRTEVIEQAYVEWLAERLAEAGYGKLQEGKLLVGGVAQTAEEITEEATKRGLTDADRKDGLGEKTRDRKIHNLSWNELRREWFSRMTDSERRALAETHGRAVPYVARVGGEREAVDHAMAHCAAREASVGERKLLTEALKRGLGAVTVEGTARELEERPLIRAEWRGRTMVALPAMEQAEGELIGMAKGGRGTLRPVGDPERPCSRDWFNEGQKAAVRAVLGSRDLVTVIRGAAGTGKTSLEAEIREALEESRVPVVAMAQSTQAVAALHQEAGFAVPVTVAHFLRHRQLQAAIRGGVVLLDEASQVGTEDMLRLFRIVKEQDARIVLVGDRYQHRPVSAGEPLRLLEERAGLPVAEVTEIVRQEREDYRQVAQAAADGRIEAAFQGLDGLGWIVEMAHAGRDWALASAYLSATLEKGKKGEPKTALVVSPTHAECDRITRAIRDALKAEKKLGEEHTLSTWVSARLTEPEKTDAANYEPGDMLQFFQNVPGHKNGSRMRVREGEKLPLQHAGRFEVYRPAVLKVAKGDRLRVTCNGWTKDGKHKLANGKLVTVEGFTPQGDPIVDKGWVIARDFGHLDYGYAVTSHGSQGTTVNKVFIGLSSLSLPAINERSFYVPITRAKEQAVVFTDDKKELLKAVQRPDEPISATELAELSRRQPPLRQRLRKHLAFMLGTATLPVAHETRHLDPQPTPPLQRERRHGR